MDVLLKAVFFGIKHASPIMKAETQRVDHLDVVGLRPDARDRHAPGHNRQGGRDHAHHDRRAELADWQVRVNAVCPATSPPRSPPVAR